MAGSAENRKSGYLDQIAERWRSYRPYVELGARISASGHTVVPISGLSGSAPSFLLSALSKDSATPILAITRHTDQAADLYEDLLFLMGEESVGHYPSRQILPYDFRAPIAEVIGRRISTLSGLRHKHLRVIVAPLRALLEPTIPVDTLDRSELVIETAREVDIELLVARLVELGFRRVPLGRRGRRFRPPRRPDRHVHPRLRVPGARGIIRRSGRVDPTF